MYRIFIHFFEIDVSSEDNIARIFNVRINTIQPLFSPRCIEYRCITGLLNGRSLHWMMEILPCKAEKRCPLQFLGLFPSFVYFLSLFFFSFVFASLPRLYDPPERSMFPLRDTRVTPFSLGRHSTIKGDKEGEVSRG